MPQTTPTLRSRPQQTVSMGSSVYGTRQVTSTSTSRPANSTRTISRRSSPATASAATSSSGATPIICRRCWCAFIACRRQHRDRLAEHIVRRAGERLRDASGARNFPQSVVGIGKIVAEGAGHIVFDASPLFYDVLNIDHIINGSLRTTPGTAYHLDPARTYFGQTKAFPENVLIDVEQLWATSEPHVAPDTAPDSRSVQMDVAYNFVQLPHDDGTCRATPTIASASMTISTSTLRTIDTLPTATCAIWCAGISRRSDPTKLSPATHPMVFCMSKTIPPRVSQSDSRRRLALERCVRKDRYPRRAASYRQPDDPNWDRRRRALQRVCAG